MSEDAVDVVVQARGAVTTAEREYAEEKVGHLTRMAAGPVLFARVDLTAHADPARERPAFAKAELDVNGRPVRAHVAAGTMFEAVDLLEARLRDRLRKHAHHAEAKHLRFRGAGEDEWHHGDWSPPRPPHFPRPVEEREVVRQKTFAVGALTPDEAVLELELLDHDFYLFQNMDTGEDNVIARAESGYELLEPSATSPLADGVEPIRHSDQNPTAMTMEDGLRLLDLGGTPFVFFLDPDDGRGRVLYRRYDGHYGLIVASSE